MVGGFKRFTAGLLSAAVIFSQSAIPILAEDSDSALLDIDFENYTSVEDLPAGFASPRQGADQTQMELVEDGENGQVLKLTRTTESKTELIIEQSIENGTIDPEKDYLFSYRFKMDGTGWYGDFIHLLDGNTTNIVNSAVYQTFFQAKTTAGSNENICGGKIGNGTWVTMDITIHPSTKQYDVKATYEDNGVTKEEYSIERVSASNFQKFGLIKFKSGTAGAVDLYIDYISLKPLDGSEEVPTPEITQEPDPTPEPEIVSEWNFDDCQSESDIPDGWVFNQDEYTTSLIDDGKGGKAVRYEKPEGANTQFLLQNTFEKIPVDISSDDLYEYGFRFKTDGTCFYGDFGKLLAANTAEIVSLGLYNGGLQVSGTQITGDVGKQDGWMTLRVVINPKESSLNAYIDYEINSEPVHKELKDVAIKSAFSDISIIKFKRNPTTDAVGFALDDIHVRNIGTEEPEPTPTPDSTPGPDIVSEWDFDDCKTESDIPNGWQFNQGAYTTKLIDDGKGGKAVRYEKSAGSSEEIKVENTFGKIPVDAAGDDLYEYGFRFKTDGTCFYGDFGKLLASNTAEIVKLNLYSGSLRISDQEITGEVGKQDGWMTLRIVINPKESSLNAYIDYEINSEPIHKELKNVAINSFSDISTIKFKRNAAEEAIGFALDDIYVKNIGTKEPEPTPTPTPAVTQAPSVLPEWDFDNCKTDEDIPSGWQFNQNDYTTKLIDDGKGGKAIKYEKPDGNSTEIKIENSFDRIPIDKTSDQLYEYGFRFKTDGTCFYGDFGKLLASDTAEVVSVNLYISDLRVANQTITNEVGKQDDWMTLRIIINPKGASLNAYVDYEIGGAPVHKELRDIAVTSPYSNAATIKFKRNATTDAVGFALDDIYFRETDPEAPEVTEMYPNDGAVGVEVNSPISITFNKEITESSVTDENIVLLDSKDSSVAKKLALSSDRKTITITPSGALSQNSSYTVSILYLEAEDGGKISKPWSASFMTEGEYNDGGIFDGKDNINIVYLGGSITAGTGASSNANRWADKVTEYFKNQYPDKTINGINKGVGGTGSDVGYFRLTKDVIANNPDVVFVEFAVNDKDNSFDDAQKQMEGIVRRLQALDKPPIIIYIYTTNQTFNAVDTSIRAHQSVADYYGIGAINLRDYMKSLVDAGKLTTSDFLADGTHPNDTGYDYYAKYIISQLRYDTSNYLKTVTYRDEKLNPDSYEFDVKYDTARNAVLGDGWIVNGDYIESSTLGSSVEYEFYGPMLAMEHWISTGSGQLKVEIDGEVYDPAFETYYYATGGQSVYWFKALDLADTKHKVKLTIIGKHANSTGYLVRIKNFLVSNDEPNAMEVMRSVPQNGEIDQTDTEPELYFTRQVAVESVNGDNFRITNANGDIVDAVVAKDQTDGRIIRITPIDYLENNAVYTVTAKAGIKAMEGDFTLAEDYVFTFTTDSSDPSILVWDRFEDDSLINKWVDLSPIAGYEVSRVDGYDGKSLRIAKTSAGKSNMNARLDFEDKGEGIYRVSYKFKAENQGLYIQDLMSVYGKTLQADGTISDGQSIVQILVYPAATVSIVGGGKASTTLLSGIQDMPDTWFDISYVLNTYTDTYDITITYTDENGNEKIITNKGLVLNADILSINSVRFKTNTGDDTGEASYLFDDLKIEKVKQPKVLSITPVDGSKDVSLRPDIEILFSEKMDEKTITSSNIRILKGDAAIAEDNYTVTSETTSDGVTKAIVKFVKDLDYKSDYKIVVSSEVSNGALAIGVDVVSSFSTRPLDIDVQSVSIKDANNNDVTSLKDMAGKTVYVRMTLKNYDGADPQSYVSTVSVNGTDNETLMISTGEGEIRKGGTEQVISSQISVPEGAENISCFVWDSFDSMTPLINKQVLGN